MHETFWVLGAIALTAPPAVLVLLRRAGRSETVATSEIGEAGRVLPATN
ncbi:MAG: hypothetical protein ACRDL5_18130 [Solirubrobacteraceae bacterium]